MQNIKPGVSLNISTYNWPQALNLCLRSVKALKVLPDEVVIADDGSTDETRKLIEKFQQDFPVAIKHVWQPDEGFQLARIRNMGIAQSSHEYIIQIDGDLILHPMFVADHISFSQRGSFVGGSRVLLSKAISEKLIGTGNTNVSILNKGIRNRLNGLHFRPLTNYLSDRYKLNDIFYLRGCNMAFWRDDLVKVNAYNEELTGWGREDNEIAIRLVNSGIKKRTLKFGAITYHLYHPEDPKARLSRNEKLLKDAIETGKVYCEKGIDQYLNK
jgi:glycosyltransferase involved in cell wall biosynthesis